VGESRKPSDLNADRASVEEFLATRTEQAFVRLYRAHTPLLFRVCLRCLNHSRASAEDAIQETWLRAMRALPTFEWRCAFSTWLVGIALRVCMESGRERAKVVSFENDPGPETPASFSADAASSLDVARALEQLPPGYRAVLVLHDLEGFTHEEIAAALGISIGTAKSQLWRARRAARELLPDHVPASREEQA
jgi:RNA polymerase sigma factor (sigma-70 family)